LYWEATLLLCYSKRVFRFDPKSLNDRPADSFALERDVRFHDVDAAGIVFFARAFEYVTDTFVAFCAASGVHVDEVLRERRWGAPLQHVEADYFRPLFFGDRVEVALVAAHLEDTSVTLGYRIANTADGAVHATVQATHVFVDVDTFARRPVPAEMRSIIEAQRRLRPA
jgi:1,4-dihydroxy-2-naphthoyl-CoA hydrolase